MVFSFNNSITGNDYSPGSAIYERNDGAFLWILLQDVVYNRVYFALYCKYYFIRNGNSKKQKMIWMPGM